MRLVLYTGKGGVGKTTTAAATAVRASERGRRTLVASADAAHSLGDVLDQRVGPVPQEVAPGLDAVEIDARVELSRHWGRIRDFLVAVFEHQGIESAVADELALLPGAEEVATLLAVEHYAESGGYDLIVVDCAPTDSTLRLVTLPDVAHRSLRVLLPLARALAGVVSPVASRILGIPLPGREVFSDVDDLIYRQLLRLQKRLTDPQTSVRIVVTPERMVIDEARRAWTELALFEIPCDAAVMNRLLPEAAADESFFEDWVRVQEKRRREVESLFVPLPVLAAPLQQDEVTGVEALARHGRQIFCDFEPEDLLCKAPPVRFRREGDEYLAIVPLPAAQLDKLDLVKIADELTITTGVRRRSLKLPRRIAPLELAGARLEKQSLVVRFTASRGGVS